MIIKVLLYQNTVFVRLVNILERLIQMFTIKNDHVTCFDVDDTLVMWDIPLDMQHKIIRIGGWELIVHEEHCNSIKKAKARGHLVVVWSQGGYEWASEVIRHLNLTDYVDFVMCKPKWIYDDLPPDAWMKRFYKELK